MENEEQWKTALDFIQHINSFGFDAFIVGGAVRDYYLHRPIHDFDIVTNASESDMKQIFARVITPTRRFETWIVPWKELVFEVTPYRSNTKRLEEDVSLRDFTINTLAVDKTGRIVDYLDGKKDIEAGSIRAFHPENRFIEDPLRLIRALRFVSQLGFGIERETWKACLDQQLRLGLIPVERLYVEIDKLLAGYKHADALYLCFEYSFPYYFPEKVRALKQTLMNRYSMENLASNTERWAAFLWMMYREQASHFSKQWGLSKAVRKKVHYILKMCTTYPEKVPWDEKLIYEAGKTAAHQTERVQQWIHETESITRLQMISQKYAALPIKTQKELSINGRDLTKLLPLVQKEEIGRFLHLLELAVIRRQVPNEKAELAAYIKEKHLNAR